MPTLRPLDPAFPIARQLGVSRMSVYRAIRKDENSTQAETLAG